MTSGALRIWPKGTRIKYRKRTRLKSALLGSRSDCRVRTQEEHEEQTEDDLLEVEFLTVLHVGP